MRELILQHQVIYDISGKAHVSDVAASLLANERLIKLSALILEECIQGFTVESVNVSIKEVANNSPLKEILCGALVIAYQDDLVREMPPIIERIIGRDIPDSYDHLVTILSMVIAIYGISAVFKKLFPEKTADKLAAAHGQMIFVAGNYMGVSPQSIENAVIKRLSGGMKQLVQKTAIDFFKPSKRGGDARIILPDGNFIPREAIAEIPSSLDYYADDDVQQYPLQNVEIEIRAVDRDQKKRGWAAVISEVTGRRLKMEIYPTVDSNRIYGRDKINGNVIVLNKKDANGIFLPSMYHLVGINENDQS